MNTHALITVLAVCALPMAACGGAASDEDQARETAANFTKAFADNNMESVCELMSSDAKKEILTAGVFFGGGDCAKVMGVVRGLLDKADIAKLKQAEIKSVKVTGNVALVESTADLDDEDDGPMRLVKRGGEWLIAADAKDKSDTSPKAADDSSGSANPSSSGEASTDASGTEATTDEDAALTPQISVAVGEPLRQDDYAVTLVGIEQASELPGDEFTDPVKADGRFTILTLRVRNTAKKVATFDASKVELVDADGTVYSAETGGGSDQIMALPDYIDEREIQAKTSETGKVAFDIPRSANVVKAQFSSSLDLFDEDFTGVVDLPS